MAFNIKTIAFTFIILTWACVIPFQSMGKLVITTHLATGQIVTLQEDIIELDNGSLYFPGNKNLKLDISEDDIVTLEFYTNPEGKNYYIKFALGENSFSIAPQPEKKPRSERKPIY